MLQAAAHEGSLFTDDEFHWCINQTFTKNWKKDAMRGRLLPGTTGEDKARNQGANIGEGTAGQPFAKVLVKNMENKCTGTRPPTYP